MTKPKGWLKAVPLENYSSLNELSFGQLIGLNHALFDKHFFLQFCFNLDTPLKIDSRAYLTFEMRDANQLPSSDQCCYSITQLNRWRLDIREYNSLDDFLKDGNKGHRNRYKKSKRTFFEYGCVTKYQEKDWLEHVPEVYNLYAKVADRHGEWLYDLAFFQECAKREDYSLLTAWYKGEMIAMNLLQKESAVLHSVCLGFDYVHSSLSYAYSWLNYKFIELAILSDRYSEVDVGITADFAKNKIGYHLVPSRIDIYSNNLITRGLLYAISPFIKTKIDTDGKLKLV